MRQQIGRDGQVVVAVRQTHRLETPPLPLRQAHLPHQPANAFAPATLPALLQPAPHARAAVFAPAFGVRRRASA
jgi:hypothetical protein